MPEPAESVFPSIAEHPLDVLRAADILIARHGACVLAVVTATEGGAVRAPGAMMAVGPDGTRFGYLSGGCIDADAAASAVEALAAGEVCRKRYGLGSAMRDLALPCGGGIDVAFVPVSDVSALLAALQRRACVSFGVSEHGLALNGLFSITPKLRLRIAGRGADLLALARTAGTCGYEVRAQTPDADCQADLERAGVAVETLQVPRDLPPAEDDAWTAFVLMFHDRDWEVPLLQQALAGDAFYIGAVGSSRAHALRLDALRAAGTDARAAARIHGPIGLVPSMRDASSLAISTLAEILAEFKTNTLKVAA